MFDELDEAVRQLLIREMPIKMGEVDIAFDLPNRDWSSRLNRPTLNLYLFDVRENAALRRRSQDFDESRNADGVISRRRKPVRLDLMYMMTAWATTPDDEHRILGRAAAALFRYLAFPKELIPEGIRESVSPVTLYAAQRDMLERPADVWGSLDNNMRPAIGLMLTISMNPYAAFDTPPVRQLDVRVGRRASDSEVGLDLNTREKPTRTIGGRIRSSGALEGLRIQLAERGLPINITPEGQYSIQNIEDGAYTLMVSLPGRKTVQRKIKVPGDTYDVALD